MAYSFDSLQITDNETNDFNPQVSDFGNVVWQHKVSSNNIDLHYYDDQGEFEIAVDSVRETRPDMSDVGNVVYEYQASRNNRDILYYDYEIEDTTTIADSLKNELKPQIDGANIVYEYQFAPQDTDIYLFNIDNEQTTLIAGSGNRERNPQISGDYIVYESVVNPGNKNIYRYDIATGATINIATEINSEYNAHVSDLGHVVYQYQFSRNDIDLRLYDNFTGSTLTLAASGYNEKNPDIAGNYVSWQAWDGNDWEVYRYDVSNGNTTQVTDNQLDDTNASVSDEGFVVWEHEFSNTDIDISLYTGSETLTLGTSTYNEINPDINGSEVAWQAWDGHDYEIYQASVYEV